MGVFVGVFVGVSWLLGCWVVVWGVCYCWFMKDSCWVSVINVFGRGRCGVGFGVRSVFCWLAVSGRLVVAVLVLSVSVVVPVGAVEGVLTPTGLTASSTVGGVLLEWDGPVGDSGSVTGYRILRRRVDVGERRLSQLVRDTGTALTSYLDESAVDGGVYIYRVRAMRGGVRSAKSDKATVVYEAPPVLERAASGEPEFEVVWSSVLSVGALLGDVPGFQNYQGPSFAQGSLLEDRFVVDGESVWVIAVFNHAGLVLGLSDELPRDFVFRAGSQEFVASDSSVQSMGIAEGRYWWPTAPMGWSEGDEVELSIAISVSGSMPQRPPAPPSGVFDDKPTFHDGVSQFEVRLGFDHANLAINAQTLKDHGLAAAGAEIAEVRRYSRSSKQSWIVALQPTGPGAITVMLPATVDCAHPGAVCTNDGRGLRHRIETTIPGSADASLAALDVVGADLAPMFDPGETLYSAAAAPGVSQLTVAAAAAAAAQGATVSITPADADVSAAGHQVLLATGADTAIHITVTAPDAATTQRYWLVVSESSAPTDATSALNSMQFTGLGSLTFDDHQNRYQLTAPPNMSHTTVVASRADSGATVETITVRVGPDGLHADHDDADTNQPGHQVPLAETGDTLVIVRVTSHDGLNQSVYLTLITQTTDTGATPKAVTPPPSTSTTALKSAPSPKDTTDNAAPVLSSLTLTDADLSPVFASDTFQYRATAASDVEEITIDAATDDTDASLLIVPADTDPNTDGWQITLGAPGSETTIVVIVNSNGKLNSYLVTVSRETVQTATTLQSLSIDGHELTPVFDSATNLYAADTPAEVSEVTIRAVATDPGAIIQAVPADADPNQSGHQLSLGAPGAQSTTSVAFVVTAPGATGHNTYVVSVTRAAPDPADASLRSLTVDGHDLTPAFASDTYPYEVSVPAEVDSVTVDAVASSLAATVTVTPADADLLQPGYEIPLGAVEHGGEPSVTAVTVSVVSQDNATTNTYTILITRAAQDMASGPPFAHNPDRDIDTLWNRRSVRYPRLWSDGEIMWATNNNEFTIYAYDLETGAPLPERNIALISSGSPYSAFTRGLWSDGETLWVAMAAHRRVTAYDLATGARLEDRDFFLAADNSVPEGLWSDGVILWVSNANENDKVFAYDFATGDRLPDHDFNNLAATGNTGPMGLWSDGAVMWVADLRAGALAYDLYTHERLPTLDFSDDTVADAGISTPMGLWSDGETMWMISALGKTIRALNMPARATGGTVLQSLELTGILSTGGGRRFDYEVFVGSTVTATTVTATAASPDATVVILPEDADVSTTEHEVNLSEGANIVTVTVTNGSETSVFSVTVTQLDVPVVSFSVDLGSLSVVGADIGTFDPATDSYEAVVAVEVDTVTVVAMPSVEYSTVDITPADSDDATAGHQVSLRAGYNQINITVESVDGSNRRVYTVRVARASDAPFGWNPVRDIELSGTAGHEVPGAVWSDGDVMWVLDESAEKIVAYDLATGARRPEHDFGLHWLNGSPMGLWSDGEIMWVGDYADDVIYAYDLYTGARRPARDIPRERDRLNVTGLWSDGTILWASDTPEGKLWGFDLATGDRRGNRDFTNLTAVGNWRPSGLWSDETTMWVADNTDGKLYAYNLATGHRRHGMEFNNLNAAGNRNPRGLWSDGTTMWVVDHIDHRIYAYNMPTDE